MNSSLWSTDRDTHLKIVIVAAIASALVALIGMYSRDGDTTNGSTQIARPATASITILSADEHSATQ